MGSDGGKALGSAAISADALDTARFGFHRAFPPRSAKRRIHFTQALWMGALLAGGIWATARFPTAALAIAHGAGIAIFAAAIFVRLAAAANLKPEQTRLATPSQWPTFTILCPLYREANVAHDLVAALLRLDYPAHAVDIKLLVEEDDAETLAAALAAVDASHMEVVAVPAAQPRTKPKALNIGLARARGDYVVVFDAEDRPHPQQLRAALTAFENGPSSLACVQAPLLIDNAETSWIARQFAAEYAVQFAALLPFLARAGLPLPLGGSSNYFRTNALRDAGGWDPFNVTEDADVGYRLARNGQRIGVIAPPTWEEAPVSLGAWLDQRTRWIKGHLQTWLVLMRNPLCTISEMGLRGFLAMQLMLGGGLLAAIVHGPLACIVAIAALTPYDLLSPADFVLALFGYCVAVFATLTASARSGQLSPLGAVLTMPLYWPLATIAAARAMIEFLLRPHHWSKTDHGLSPRTQKIGRAPANSHVWGAEEALRGRA
jgi:cellulose synthase/poly-beta-1,6-N-acetylglucosamine synthase-like glycosyltransferase